MKRAYLLPIWVLFGLFLLVGCGGSAEPSGIGPSSVLTSGTAALTWSPLGDRGRPLPPVAVGGDIGCPTDAPGPLEIGSQEGHITVYWRQVPRVAGYEFVLERYQVNNKWDVVLAGTVGDSTEGIEITPGLGRYRIRVRSILGGPFKCAGFGQWSGYAFQSI